MSQRSTQNGTIKNHNSVYNNNTNATKEAADKDAIVLSQNSHKNVSALDNNAQPLNYVPSSFLQNNQQVFGVSSSLMMGDKSNNSNSVDEEKMIMEVILSGQLIDLKHFGMKNRSLNYVRELEATSSIDKKVSPLIVAVYCGNIDHVKELFNCKAEIDVNYASKKSGISPLMVSCMRGQFEIVQYLIQKGADINQTSNDGLPPLYYCFQRLEEDHNYFENKNLCMKMACYLLEKGANINQIVNQDNKHTLLMQFCNIHEDLDLREKDINLSMIKFLVQNGADIFIKNTQGLDCYDLIDKHPYRDEVIKIFEQYENTVISNNFRTTAENTNERSAQFIHTSPRSRNNQLKQKKRSQMILTSQSSNSHLNMPTPNQPQIQQQQINAIQQMQQKQQQQSAKFYSKHSQNIEIEGEEKKHNPCCSLFFF